MISMDKQYTTRGGRPVRVLCLDAKGNFPVVAVVDSGQAEVACLFTQDGCYHFNKQAHPTDLIEVKPKRTVEVWINHYHRDCTICGYSYSSEATAKESRSSDCIATTHHTITFEEGEGL